MMAFERKITNFLKFLVAAAHSKSPPYIRSRSEAFLSIAPVLVVDRDFYFRRSYAIICKFKKKKTGIIYKIVSSKPDSPQTLKRINRILINSILLGSDFTTSYTILYCYTRIRVYYRTRDEVLTPL